MPHTAGAYRRKWSTFTNEILIMLYKHHPPPLSSRKFRRKVALPFLTVHGSMAELFPGNRRNGGPRVRGKENSVSILNLNPAVLPPMRNYVLVGPRLCVSYANFACLYCLPRTWQTSVPPPTATGAFFWKQRAPFILLAKSQCGETFEMLRAPSFYRKCGCIARCLAWQ